MNSAPDPTNQIYECQKYDDHVLDVQTDNVFVQNTGYNEYIWTCGDGVNTVCANPDCIA